MTPILVLLFGVHPATAVGTDLLVRLGDEDRRNTRARPEPHRRLADRRASRRRQRPGDDAHAGGDFELRHFGCHDSAVISLVLGVMLLLTALSLIFRRQFLSLVGPVLERVPPGRAGRITIFIGMILGALVTISSVGAGALGVTALLMFYPRVPMAVIVGSDIAHAVLLTLVAGIGHWWWARSIGPCCHRCCAGPSRGSCSAAICRRTFRTRCCGRSWRSR